MMGYSLEVRPDSTKEETLCGPTSNSKRMPNAVAAQQQAPAMIGRNFASVASIMLRDNIPEKEGPF